MNKRKQERKMAMIKKIKNVQTIAALIIVAFMIITGINLPLVRVEAATTLEVKLEGSSTAYKGQTYVLNVNLPNVTSAAPKGLAAFEINIKFDNNKFQFVKSTNKTGVSTGFSNPDLISANELKLNFVNSNNPITKTTFATVEFTCKSSASGSASFTATIEACNTLDGGIKDIPYNVTNRSVNIETYVSSNSNLSKLAINLRSLNPSFNKNTLNYSVNIGNSYTSVEVTAEVEDSSSTVSIKAGSPNIKVGNVTKSGKTYKATVSDLQVGENSVKVEVKAQNGSTKTYTININRYPPASSQGPSPEPGGSSGTSKTPGPSSGSPSPATESPTPGETPAEETPSPTDATESPIENSDSPEPASPTPHSTPASSQDPPLETPPGGLDDFLETFLNMDTSIMVGLTMALFLGLAIGFGIGYYVGWRKGQKIRYRDLNLD